MKVPKPSPSPYIMDCPGLAGWRKAVEVKHRNKRHCWRLAKKELITVIGTLTLVITMVYEAPKSSSPSSRVNSPISVMHFPLLYLDIMRKYSISQLVSQTKSTKQSYQTCHYNVEDVRHKAAVTFFVNHKSSCHLFLP